MVQQTVTDSRLQQAGTDAFKAPPHCNHSCITSFIIVLLSVYQVKKKYTEYDSKRYNPYETQNKVLFIVNNKMLCSHCISINNLFIVVTYIT